MKRPAPFDSMLAMALWSLAAAASGRQGVKNHQLCISSQPDTRPPRHDRDIDGDVGATGQPSIAEVPDRLLVAADDFSELASDIDDAGRELRRVPACETFIRNFDAVFAGLDAGSEVTETTTPDGGVNTDVADGICDQDRWLQDPDCGNSSVANSDLADGTCDDSRFFTDPDC